MADCIFCKIIAGEIAVTPVHRDDDVVVVTDINPQAPKHLLAIPVRHVETLAELAEANPEITAKLMAVAASTGRSESPEGYRLVVNTGEHGGQTVDHVHVHVLGGRPMGWPPG